MGIIQIVFLTEGIHVILWGSITKQQEILSCLCVCVCVCVCMCVCVCLLKDSFKATQKLNPDM